MKLIFILWLALSPCLLWGQDFKADMDKSSRAYQETDRYHMNIRIWVGEAGKEGTVYEQAAVFYKDKEKMRYEIEGLLMLVNEHYSIVVNHNTHEIMCQKSEKQKRNKATDMMNLNLDSLAKEGTQVAYIGEESSAKHYRISQKEQQILQADIWLNSQSFFIEKMEYLYAKDEAGRQFRVVINFVQKPFPESPHLFSEKEFIQDNGKGGLKPAPKYARYEFSAQESNQD